MSEKKVAEKDLTKEEISEKLNNTLGLDIDFSKLSKNDLGLLLKNLCSKEGSEVSSELFRRPIKELLNHKLLNRPLGDLTIAELIQSLLPGRRRKGKGGLFGFGILPIELDRG